MIADDLDEPPAVLRLVEGAAQQRLRETLNGGKRRAELVGNVRDEIPPHPLEPADLGDVEDDQHRPPLPRRGGPHQERARLEARGRDLGLLSLSAAPHVLDHRENLALTCNFHEPSSLETHSCARRECPAKGGVRISDALLAVDHRDPLGHRREDGRRLVVLLFQESHRIPDPRDGVVDGLLELGERVVRLRFRLRAIVALRHSREVRLETEYPLGEAPGRRDGDPAPDEDRK